MVGVRGFEPPASASRTQRSSQTEPHPDLNSDQRFALFHNVALDDRFFKPFFVKKSFFLQKLWVLRRFMTELCRKI